MKKLYILPFIIFMCCQLQSCKATKLTDKAEIKDKMVKALEWQEANPIHSQAPTDWTNGAYYTGVARAHQTIRDKVFFEALENMGERNEWQTWERYFHADDLAISYAYLYLKSIGSHKVDLKPTSNFINDHLNKPHEWRTGTGTDSTRKILWWWCDALFMAPPVLAQYAKMENDRTYLDEMHKYFMETYNLLYDKEANLFARDAKYLWTGNASDMKEPNGKKIFWSRGNGWVLGGLALILEDMPKDYEHRAFYVTLYREMAAKVKELQPADGLWRTSLLDIEPYDHGEVSGSGFFIFALAWGINNGILDKTEYTPGVIKSWNALEKCQQSNGMVGWVQNIGAEPKPASKDDWQNYGTGAFLMAGSEILKLK